MTEQITLNSTIAKVDEGLGLVFGWAIVCKENGVDYFDLQDDHISEEEMLKAATDFALNSRVAKEMHEGNAVGTVAFVFPLTTEVAKAFGLETKRTGLMIAMKPTAEVFAKFKDGTYKGFSIGGSGKREEIAA